MTPDQLPPIGAEVPAGGLPPLGAEVKSAIVPDFKTTNVPFAEKSPIELRGAVNAQEGDAEDWKVKLAAKLEPLAHPKDANDIMGLLLASDAGAALASNRTSVRVATSAGVAFGAGIAKEVYDRYSGGDSSWRDLTWDAVGTATGVLVSWLIDRYIF